jgi:hypothetical protein
MLARFAAVKSVGVRVAAPDGQRVPVSRWIGNKPPSTLIVNWLVLLKRAVATVVCAGILAVAAPLGEGVAQVSPTPPRPVSPLTPNPVAVEDMSQVEAAVPTHPIPAAPKKKYVPASVYAGPGLTCKLYAPESGVSVGLDVDTDDDGYARFYAVPASPNAKVKELKLNCTDSAGKPSAYIVDLTSADPFTSRPLNLANERGIDRPALSGDPLAYTQAELLKHGYGLRPDPQKSPAAYERWLKAASISGRMLAGKRATSPQSHTVYTTQAPPWTGSILVGAPKYVYTEAQFNVPEAIPGGDETTYTEIAIWNGLGGFGTGSGLIQGGVGIRTIPGGAVYYTFREYCCGDPYSNGYGGNFAPSVNDEIFSEQYYCDAEGNENINGGYGCSFLDDEKSGAIFSCIEADDSLCWSVPAIAGMTLGDSAEFVIEDTSPQLGKGTNQFTDFTPEVTMQGEAWSLSADTYEAVNLDPVVYVLTDFTNSTSHMNVSVSSTSENTYFSISQFEQVPGSAVDTSVPCAGPGGVCHPEAIAVGPNANGSAIGDPWVLGSGANQLGDHDVYHWVNSKWVQEPGAATQIAVSPSGVPWIIDHAGQIFYWNGAGWTQIAGCATSIGVGPAWSLDPHGSPWVIGCEGSATTNGGIYFLNGTSWFREPGGASQIAVSPEGFPWVITAAGSIYHWNGSGWTPVSGCATSIAVGPTTAPLAGPYGDVWVVGCPTEYGISLVYQFQQGTTWVPISAPPAVQISLSPDLGVPWLVMLGGGIFK